MNNWPSKWKRYLFVSTISVEEPMPFFWLNLHFSFFHRISLNINKTFYWSEYLKNNGTQLREIDEEYHRLFPLVLGYQFTVDPEKCEKISSEIREYYFQNKSIAAETDVKVVQVSQFFHSIIFQNFINLKVFCLHSFLYIPAVTSEVHSCRFSSLHKKFVFSPSGNRRGDKFPLFDCIVLLQIKFIHSLLFRDRRIK